ncbi:hypothetical protein CHELA40_30346 [Chelatococcus asaccharovorans]|nr:hypothetical protein CHELA40_30346 [Chelatococcus asaccharovorans]
MAAYLEKEPRHGRANATAAEGGAAGFRENDHERAVLPIISQKTSADHCGGWDTPAMLRAQR